MIAAEPPEPSEPSADVVAARLSEVRRRIAEVGDPATVTVVGVTKGFGPAAVIAARDAGLRDVGENYAQDLLAKAAVTEGLRRHFLGRPQRNKLARLAPLVDLWQAVDRAEILDALAARRPGAEVLVQVNALGEPGKGGTDPGAVPGLLRRAGEVGLVVRGLMCVGPAGDPGGSRLAFRTVAELAARLGLPELSMGMSDDFEAAVAAGSTMVRLGRVLFGPRPGAPGMRR